MDGEECCQVSEHLLPVEPSPAGLSFAVGASGIQIRTDFCTHCPQLDCFPSFKFRNSWWEFLWPRDPVPLPICRSVWLYTHKLKDKLSYICPNTEHHPCLRQEGNQSRCGEYRPCPFLPSCTLESTLLMSHQRWKKYSIKSLLQVDSQEPFLVSACDPGCCPCPSPRRSLLSRKSSF